MNQRGYLLLEVSIAYVILSLALAALVPVFILGLRANKSTEKLQTAYYLSWELMEEIRMRKWDENTPSPASYTNSASGTLGPDAGETATDKTKFDDIDDFNGWSESTIKDPLNNAISGFSAYSRSVTVQYVDSTLTTVSASPTDYKKVTVCTNISGGVQPVCFYTIFTNH